MSIFDELTAAIQNAYEAGVSLEEAERLAAKTLHAQLILIDQVKTADLDARMRKSGVKAVRGAVFLDTATKGEKKPSDAVIQATVDRDELVMKTQEDYDTAEVEANRLKSLMDILGNAHIHFRNVSKGAFNG